MNPKEFEEAVRDYYIRQGYDAVTTPYSNDYGVDVFATKNNEKIAIQVKMYGGTTRKINRQMIMELHGARDFFDCTEAVIATDGTLLPDAIIVAEKLNVGILYTESFMSVNYPQIHEKWDNNTFENIWQKYIMPLEGRILEKGNSRTNRILKVDWSGIERITSNGNKGTIKIEIFRLAVKKLLLEGFISRDEINQNYAGRASSGVVLILAQVPFFENTVRPTGLRYDKTTR